MATKPPLTDDERARIIDLARTGKSTRAIAAEVGRSHDAVAKTCAKAGVPLDRTQTRNATEARKADLAARRAGIIERLYRRAERNLERLEAEDYTFVAVTVNGIDHDRVPEPPANDEKALMAAISTSLTSAARLEAVDSDGGLADALSLIESVASAVKAAVDGDDAPA